MMRNQKFGSSVKLAGIVLSVSAAVLAAQTAHAQAITAAYSSQYSLTTFAGPAGLVDYAGATWLAGSTSTLLIGANDDSATAGLYSVNVIRNASNQITGFAAPTKIGTAPYLDNGLVYGPGGNLYYTADQAGEIGVLTLSGSGAGLTATADGFLNVTTDGSTKLTNYEGGLSYIPGFGGANGELAWDSYHGGGSSTYQYLVPFVASSAAGSIGGYTLGTATAYNNTAALTATAVSNEGFVDFHGNVLVSSYPNTTINAWAPDQYGLATGTTGSAFITGASNTVDGLIDPVTGNALFVTYSATAGANVLEVSATAPEPSAVALALLGIAPVMTAVVARRRKLI